MSKTFIYALIDPNTNQVRYVGKSDNPEKRLSRHLGFFEPKSTHKQNWLKSLMENHQEPILKILEEVDQPVWKDAERKWIKFYKDQGVVLTNTAEGGIGGYTGGMSPEKRVVQSQRMKEYQARLKAEKQRAYQEEMDSRRIIGWKKNGILLDPVFDNDEIQPDYDKWGYKSEQ